MIYSFYWGDMTVFDRALQYHKCQYVWITGLYGILAVVHVISQLKGKPLGCLKSPLSYIYCLAWKKHNTFLHWQQSKLKIRAKCFIWWSWISYPGTQNPKRHRPFVAYSGDQRASHSPKTHPSIRIVTDWTVPRFGHNNEPNKKGDTALGCLHWLLNASTRLTPNNIKYTGLGCIAGVSQPDQNATLSCKWYLIQYLPTSGMCHNKNCTYDKPSLLCQFVFVLAWRQ